MARRRVEGWQAAVGATGIGWGTPEFGPATDVLARFF
jgi:hypothetical protein